MAISKQDRIVAAELVADALAGKLSVQSISRLSECAHLEPDIASAEMKRVAESRWKILDLIASASPPGAVATPATVSAAIAACTEASSASFAAMKSADVSTAVGEEIATIAPALIEYAKAASNALASASKLLENIESTAAFKGIATSLAECSRVVRLLQRSIAT